MRKKRVLCCLLLAALLLTLLPFQRTELNQPRPLTSNPLAFFGWCNVEAELTAASAPRGKPAFAMPAAILRSDVAFEAARIRAVRFCRQECDGRPSILALTKNHPRLAPPSFA